MMTQPPGNRPQEWAPPPTPAERTPHPADEARAAVGTQPSTADAMPRAVAPDGTWELTASGGPCRTWPLMPGCGCLPDNPNDYTALQRYAVETATEILWRLTAGRVGLCRETVRPCRKRPPNQNWCNPRTGGMWPPVTPAIIDGRWLNITCGCREPATCGCGPVAELTLPGPVYWQRPEGPPRLAGPDPNAGTPPRREFVYRYSLEVWIDGLLLPEESFRLQGSTLFRVDGQQFPECQYLDRPLRRRTPDDTSANGTFGVVYWRGGALPTGAKRSVALLACELWKACKGSECQIPARVQTIEREGVTYKIVDPLDFLKAGHTGITEIDLWLSTINPHGLKSPPAVYSVDLPQVRSEWVSGRIYPSNDSSGW